MAFLLFRHGTKRWVLFLLLNMVLPCPFLEAKPQLIINGQTVTTADQALPLVVVHGKAIRLGESAPQLSPKLFQPLFSKEIASLINRESQGGQAGTKPWVPRKRNNSEAPSPRAIPSW